MASGALPGPLTPDIATGVRFRVRALGKPSARMRARVPLRLLSAGVRDASTTRQDRDRQRDWREEKIECDLASRDRPETVALRLHTRAQKADIRSRPR